MQYAQQTDPEKAKVSSIDLTQQAPESTSDLVGSPIKKTTTETYAPTQETPATNTPQTQQPVSTGSYYQDVYLPKVQAERARRQGIQQVETPAPSKAEMMDAKTIASGYEGGSLSAIELENLRTSDPLKYKEAKIEIERKRTLDAINNNSASLIETQKSMTESFLQKRETLTSNQEGKNLREEVLAKYGLTESNEKILGFTKQIDEVDAELEKLMNWTGTGDALADRAQVASQTRDLMKRRTDLVKNRSAEVDYYKLGLEQADAVMSDYKEYNKDQINMLGKKFELLTGLSQMEFEQKNKLFSDELLRLDKEDEKVRSEIEKEEKKQADGEIQAQDEIFVKGLASIYGEFTPEDQAVLVGMGSKNAVNFLKSYREILKENQPKDKKYVPVKVGDITYMVNNDDPSDYQVFGSGDINTIVSENILPSNSFGGQCTDYAERVLGYDASGQYTLQNKIDLMNTSKSSVPVVGSVFVMDVGTEAGHVGVVTGLNEDGTIEISDSNRNNTERVRNTTIDPKDYKILGYYIPPNGKKTENVISGLSTFKLGLTAAQSDAFDAQMQEAVKKGDSELALINMRMAYRSSLGQTMKDRLDGRKQLGYNLRNLDKMLSDYVSQGGDIGFFTGKTEEIANRIGQTSDPKLAFVQTQIKDLLDQVARERTGAALTPSEEAFYQRLLPSIGKSLERNRAIVQGFLQRSEGDEEYVDYYIQQNINQEAREFLFPPERDPKDFSSRLTQEKASTHLVD